MAKKKVSKPKKVIAPPTPTEVIPETPLEIPIAIYNPAEDIKERATLIFVRDEMTKRGINDLGALGVILERLENKIKHG